MTYRETALLVLEGVSSASTISLLAELRAIQFIVSPIILYL